jgi:hypothetical protein
MIGVVGVPGTGKSHFARSARELGKTLIALTDPKESSFYGPEGVTLFHDFEWRPHASSFQADAFLKLLSWCDTAAKSDAQYIVIDTGSEASDLAMHECLKMHATNDPGDVSHGKAWIGHDQKIKELVTELRRLVARDKTVIVAFHGQMKEMEGAGAARQGISFGDKNVKEWKFDEQLLPAMMTQMRQRIHSVFDLWLYTNPMGFGPARKWYVTAQADSVRPAKHSVNFKAGVNLAMIPNDLKTLFGTIQTEAK